MTIVLHRGEVKVSSEREGIIGSLDHAAMSPVLFDAGHHAAPDKAGMPVTLKPSEVQARLLPPHCTREEFYAVLGNKFQGEKENSFFKSHV